jgi:hypothetical protein
MLRCPTRGGPPRRYLKLLSGIVGLAFLVFMVADEAGARSGNPGKGFRPPRGAAVPHHAKRPSGNATSCERATTDSAEGLDRRCLGIRPIPDRSVDTPGTAYMRSGAIERTASGHPVKRGQWGSVEPMAGAKRTARRGNNGYEKSAMSAASAGTADAYLKTRRRASHPAAASGSQSRPAERSTLTSVTPTGSGADVHRDPTIGSEQQRFGNPPGTGIVDGSQ